MKSFLKRLRNISLVFVLLIWQVVFAGAPLLSNHLAHAAPVCTVDTAGANDVPGQKDLTKMCTDTSGLPTTEHITWNWDELGTSGSNSMDACALFDTNGNGNADYSACVTTNNNPATFSSLSIYQCSDSAPDRCFTDNNSHNPIAGPYSTSCTVSQTNTDPFSSGASYPADTTADCTVYLSDVGGESSASLIDVCSYPSSQPNSDPSDCVVAQPSSAKLEVVKDLSPSNDPGLFDLKIDGSTYATAVGNGGSTGEQIVDASKNKNTHTVAEVASSSSPTPLSNYTTSYVCKDLHGTGTTLTSGTLSDATSRQFSVTVQSDTDVVCTFTNTRQGGSITVTKVVNNNNGGTKSASDFPLFVNSTQVTSGASNNFDAGQSYTISETNQTGYHQDSIVCKNTADNSTLNNPFTLSSNENVSCTITNSDIAPKLTLIKHVSGGSATVTDWTLSATPADNQYSTLSGSGGFSDQTARANEQYTLGESGGPSGYSAGSWSCDGGSLTSGNKLTLALADDVTCNITNTRDTGTLTVNKLLVPSNDSGLFNLSMTGPTSFTANDQGNNGTTGAKTVDTGSYTVSEAAGTNTSLSNYSSSYSCVDGQTTVASGNATTSDSFNVAKGQSIVCTFTNTRYGSISGFKYEVNADSSQVGALESWTIYLYDSQNNLIGTTTTDSLGNFVFSNLLAGSYTLGENLQTGWTQIYSPNGVTLTAGQNSTDNNFGNFQNAEISGMKFNDVNGNHQKDSGEGGLSGWTINLSKSDGHGGWTSDGSTVTGSGGAYSFTDLAPGSYKLCETSQTGWTQTYPTTNSGCNLVDVVLSGNNYSDINFGNQGQGTITVIKNVNDGFGNVTSDVTTWTWGYSGTLGSGSGLSTGSSNSQSVAAGDYTVSENQKTGYHVTASSCTGESDTSVNTSKSVTVSPGEDVTCTFTNTRDTGTIEVVKNLLPSNDTGKFDLSIDGTTKANNVGNGGTTGAVTVVTGTHGVSETAGTSTSLNNYESSYVCTDTGRQVKSGDGTSISDINVAYGDEVVCTFTNTRHATLTIVKNVDDGFDNVSTDVKTWTWGYDGVSYDDNLATGSNNSQELAAGDYSVWENQQTDYHFTSVSCSDGSANVSVTQSEQFDVTLDPGENLTCTFLNTRDTGTITVVKNLYPSNDPGKFNLQINGQNYATDVGDQGTTNAVTVVTGDNYNVSETAGTGTDLKNYQSRYWCTDEETYGDGTQSDNFSVGKDQNITCYFENYRLGINVVKTGPATAEPGQTVTYTFTVTNTGYLPLSGITVNDDIAGAGVYQSGDTNNDNMLETNETWIFTANYTIPKDQFNSVTNTVTACGTTGGIEQIEALDSQLNNSKTVCAQDSHTLVIPKVLAEVTPPQVLANTGQSAWAGVVAGLTMLSLVLGINTAFGRQTKKQR